MKAKVKELHIYIDESGDYSPYTEDNPLYSIAFVMVENELLSSHSLQIFKNHLKQSEGGDHFVHTGNLVRAEVPYKGMLRDKRINLFYALFLFAKHAKYKVCCSNVIKRGHDGELDSCIKDCINKTVLNHNDYLKKFEKIILHYDNGQDALKGIIMSAFKNNFRNVIFLKTLQKESAFMQVADLFSYLELIKFKIKINNLSKSEIAFFGIARKIRKNYIEQLKEKYL